MKNYQKGIAPIIIALIVAVVLGGGYVLVKQQGKNSPKVENTAATNTDTANWKTYSDTSLSFNYPSLLSVWQDGENGEIVVLSHSIAYKHADFCDFKGDEKTGQAGMLDNLLDFSISFKIVNQNLKELVQSTDYPGWEYVSANPYKLGSLNGYKVSESIEGCGKDVYYFTLSPTKTLVVDRFLTEFNQGISILPGVITPAQADTFFTKIITSIKVK